MYKLILLVVCAVSTVFCQTSIDCKECSRSVVPQPQNCSDGLPPKQYCNITSCSWVVLPCPNPNNTILCLDDECDCYDDSNCPSVKPTATCQNAHFFCASGALSNATSSGAAPKTSTGVRTCQWNYICLDTPPITSCNNGCNDQAHPTYVVQCLDGSTSKWECIPVSLPFTASQASASASAPAPASASASPSSDDTNEAPLRSCTWASVCPPALRDNVTCKSYGVCGEFCREDNADSSNNGLPDVDTTICRENATCEQQCFLAYSVGCVGIYEQGCVAVTRPGYGDCIETCNNTSTQPAPSTCFGSVCSCDYSNCLYCQEVWNTANGNSHTRGACISSAYGDACKALNGSGIYNSPTTCYAVKSASSSSDSSNAIVNALAKFDRDDAQAKIDADSTIKKDFMIIIVVALDPDTTNSNDIKAPFVVSITGDREPSSSDAVELCDLIRKAISSSTSVNFQSCSLNKASTGSVSKRALLQSSTSNNFVATMGTGSQSSGAATLFTSVAAILAAVALLY